MESDHGAKGETGVNTKFQVENDGICQSWEFCNFFHLVAIAQKLKPIWIVNTEQSST